MNLANFRVVVSLFILMGLEAQAAIPVQQAASEKKDHYLESGVFVGGHDQGALSLLNVRHSFQKKNRLERIVFDLDSRRPGFFHISVQKNLHRVVVDLENIAKTEVSPRQIAQVVKKSYYFTNAKTFFDSRTHNLTIELPMRTSTRVEVFELAGTGKSGRIVLDAKGR